jgi:3-methyladenine DNA glycosylase/8-oxoguanine DNA glycosylase
VLGARLNATPGLRVPGAFDHFETAVVLLVHQHLSPEEGCDLLDRIVEKYGKRIETSQPSLTHVFPTPYALSVAKLEAVGVPTRRSRAIQSLAKAVHEGGLRLDGTPSLDAAIEGLRSIADVSATTAQYIAMRVYREPDAFPSGNRWLREAVCENSTPIPTPDLESRAESWRPWRAYAAMLLWDGFIADDSGSSVNWIRESEPPQQANQVA